MNIKGRRPNAQKKEINWLTLGKYLCPFGSRFWGGGKVQKCQIFEKNMNVLKKIKKIKALKNKKKLLKKQGYLILLKIYL